MYGLTYKKPTRFWTNIEGLEFKSCNHKGVHIGGQHSQTGEWNKGKLERYKIPEKLIENILENLP